MNAKLLFGVDALVFIALLISTITGIMMMTGTRGVREIHVIASMIFVAIVIIHILLHYKWIKAMLKI